MTTHRPDLASDPGIAPRPDVAAGHHVAGPDVPRTGAATLLLTALGPLVTWTVVMGLAALLAPPEVGPSQCEGIGFGCTLAPRDLVGIMAMVGGVVAVPIATLVSIVIVLRLPVRARRTGALIVVGTCAVLSIAVGLTFSGMALAGAS